MEEGRPACDPGYEWEDPEDRSNLRCVPAAICEPTTCDAAGKNCGEIADGCGGQLSCGNCFSPDSCGGGDTAGVCGCTPAPCGAQCGKVPDGCGGMRECDCK